jgi:hypothetical protein
LLKNSILLGQAALALLVEINHVVSKHNIYCCLCSGMCWRQFMTFTGAEPEAWKYLAVAVPFATIAGPTGAFLASYCHRQVLAAFVYILDTLALVRIH